MKRRSFTVVLLMVLLMVLAVNPLSAKVKRVTSRALKAPSVTVTSRKANFKMGDILDTPMLSMTISNDNTSSPYLLLVLQLDIDDSDAGTTLTGTAEFEKQFAINETFTFTNTDILDYVSNVRGGSASDDMKQTFGISGGMSSITESFFTNANLSIPEGSYTLSLKAYEIAKKGDPISSGTLKGQNSLTFNVINVGSIAVLKSPSPSDKTMTFRVPEIPYYSDSSIPTTSTTSITITGAGVTQSKTKQHTRVVKSLGSNIKGYPGDLADGEVTYDLSDVKFRAGESYTIAIMFKDSYGYEIASDTMEVKFPTPKFAAQIDTSSPYKPEFSWYFNDDYDSWAKEYRIYLNNQYVGYTTGNSYTPSTTLLPNTTYSWYVMPINQDGSNFFASTSSLSKSFTTKAHTDLTLNVDTPRNQAVLITGQNYEFASNPTFSDDASLKSATWRIGVDTKNGETVTYLPAKRYVSGSLLAYLTVVDSLNLTKRSDNLYLTVLDPALVLQGGTSRTVDTNREVYFALDMTKTQDIQTVQWLINGSPVGEGNTFSYTFEQSGTYSVAALGTSASDSNGYQKEVRSAVQQVTAVGEGPTAAITQPEQVVEMVVGTSLDLKGEITFDNQQKSIGWTYGGAATGTLASGTGNATFSPTVAGDYTITLTATDIHQKQSTASIRVLVLDPQLQVSYPTSNAIFSLQDTLTPVVNAPNASSVTYRLNGRQVETPFALSTLGSGTYSLVARASWDVVDQQGKPRIHTKDSNSITIVVKDLQPPSVSIAFPQRDMLFKTGIAYRLEANAASISPLRESWWDVDGTRLSTNTYTPPVSTTKKLVKLTYHAINQDGVEGKQSVEIKLANPSVYLKAPQQNRYLSASVIPIAAAAVDGQLYWLVDGVEIPSWDKTIEQSGSHTIQAGWRMEAYDGQGNLRTYEGQSEKATVTIYSDKPPMITSFSPNTSIIHQRSGTPVIFAVQASSENSLQTTLWNIYSGSDSIRETAAASISHQSWLPGLYTVRAQVKDEYGQAVTQDWTVKIIDPKVVITFPQPDMRFAVQQVPKPVVESSDVSSVTMTLNGTAITDQFDWNTLKPGAYTLSVVGTYTVTGTTQLQNTPAQNVSFRIEDRTPPRFTVHGIADNDRLVAGLTYHLIVDSQADEQITWLIDGAIAKQGKTFEFTPNKQQKSITLTVRAVRNNITVDSPFKLRIIDPYINLLIPANLAFEGLYAPNMPIPLLYESRDIDRVQWTVDLKPFTGSAVRFQPGMHSIDLVGFASSVRLVDATLGDYQSIGAITSRDIQVAEAQTVLSIKAPEYVLSSQSFPLEASVQQQGTTDLIASLSYRIDGAVYREEKRPAPRTITVSGLPSGTHTLSVVSTDVFGNTQRVEKPITVLQNLAFTIISPVDGQRLSPDANLLASLSLNSGNVELITWRVDNNVVPNSNATTLNLGKLGPGRHTIVASARDRLGTVVSQQVQVEVQSDFQLNLAQPSKQTELIIGNSLTALVSLEKVSGSSIDLSDAASRIRWYINGQDTGSNGLSYIFQAKQAGSYTIQARYANGPMIRTTGERTIIVRDIIQPTITQPLNGQRITYTPQKRINLSATGEPGATYQWMIGGSVLAVGPQTSFDPAGLSGNVQLTLVTTAYDRTAQRLASITLVRNTKPTLTLTVPPLQYTNEILQFSAIAFDVEDAVQNPKITYTLDGVELPSSGQYRLKAEDSGSHVLVAKTEDSAGEATIQNAVFTVVPAQIDMQLLSPQEGGSYFKGSEIALLASLPNSEQGTFTWTIQYVDDPSLAKETFPGNAARFTAKASGQLDVSVVFKDTNNRERARKHLMVTVKAQPVALSINWPYASVVNAGVKLQPILLGLPAEAKQTDVTWYLNGSEVRLSELKAPEQAGPATLSVVYAAGGTSQQASVQFTVNAKPVITMRNLLEGSAHQIGIPLVLASTVEDDQPFTGTVKWSLENGSPIGEGNPLIYIPEATGKQTIVATVSDGFGFQGSAKVGLTFFAPVKLLSASVNGDRPSYLIAENSTNLQLRASLESGIAPEVLWRIKQGNRVLEKKGQETSLQYAELNQLLREPSVITMILSDKTVGDGTLVEVARREFPILFTSDATAVITQPTADSIQHVGQAITLQLAMTGFKAPSFTTTLNGENIPVQWQVAEGSQTAQAVLPSQLFAKEGVYELAATVTEQGLVRTAASSLNLYSSRQGVFVDDVPEVYELGTPSVVLHAVIAGLQDVEHITWLTDLSTEPVAEGPTFDLSAATWQAGDRSITVQSHGKSGVLSSSTYRMKVLDQVRVSIEGSNETLILQQGAEGELKATGFDRDGKALEEAAFSWKSHLDGTLGTGSTVSYATLEKLQEGEHAITVTAIGSEGASNAASRTVMIKAQAKQNPATGQQQQDQQNQQNPEDQTPQGGPPPDMFNMGAPIDQMIPSMYPDPFGMGGAPPDPGLGNYMNSFFGGMGGGGGFGPPMGGGFGGGGMPGMGF
ncbi:MAG: hypothetical protein AB7C91_05670 [Sphaerochaeta sp.]|uniref:hypothetical protein n=1 Tax=Sphaerochaeta sp. TaxID=1972642 RepID=UPI003D10C98F